jgi:arabinosyltransferase C
MLSLVLAVSAAALVLRMSPFARTVGRTRARRVSVLTIQPRRWLDNLVVAAVLLLWWLFGPALLDDGWVLATVRNFGAAGVFSSYFDTNNTVLPLGYVHDLVISMFFQASDSLLWLRLPALLAGLGTWVICISTVRAAIGSWDNGRALFVRMTAAAVFLLSWISWNNTLRPEPLIALLVSISLWAAMRWHHGSNPTFVLIGLVASALALSMGASGVVALAPWILLLPRIFFSIRAAAREALPFLVVSALLGSTIFVLALLSSGEVQFWSAARNSFQSEVHHSSGLLDEASRYQGLFSLPHSNSVRQLSVLLPLVAPLMFVIRLKAGSRSPLNVPVLAFVVAVVLLGLTPSKWIWHFGAMTPLVTVAVALETYRWKSAKAPMPRGGVLVVAGFLSLIAILVWDGWFGWNIMALGDIEELGTALRVHELPTPAILAAAAVVGLAFVSTISGTRRQASAMHILQDFIRHLLPVTGFVAIGIALFVFVADGLFLSPDWSLARQNLAELKGDTCGAAEHTMMHFGDRKALPTIASLGPFDGIPGPLARHRQVSIEPARESISFADDNSIFTTWESNGSSKDGLGWFASPWFGLEGLDTRQRAGLLVDAKGPFSSERDDLFVQVAYRVGSQLDPGPLLQSGSRYSSSTWKPLNIGFHLAAPSASAVRIVAMNRPTGSAGSLAFSEPYVYESNSSLEEQQRFRGGPVLVAPHLGTYFPCFEQPELKGGQAQVPSLVLSAGGWPLELPGSPYRYLSDIANLTAVPVTWRNRTDGPPFEVLVVEPNIER